jgi:hypothetical protein
MCGEMFLADIQTPGIFDLHLPEAIKKFRWAVGQGYLQSFTNAII